MSFMVTFHAAIVQHMDAMSRGMSVELVSNICERGRPHPSPDLAASYHVPACALCCVLCCALCCVCQMDHYGSQRTKGILSDVCVLRENSSVEIFSSLGMNGASSKCKKALSMVSAESWRHSSNCPRLSTLLIKIRIVYQ